LAIEKAANGIQVLKRCENAQMLAWIAGDHTRYVHDEGPWPNLGWGRIAIVDDESDIGERSGNLGVRQIHVKAGSHQKICIAGSSCACLRKNRIRQVDVAAGL